MLTTSELTHPDLHQQGWPYCAAEARDSSPALKTSGCRFLNFAPQHRWRHLTKLRVTKNLAAVQDHQLTVQGVQASQEALNPVSHSPTENLVAALPQHSMLTLCMP